MTKLGQEILGRFDLSRWQYREPSGNLLSMDIPEVRALYDLVCALEAGLDQCRGDPHE